MIQELASQKNSSWKYLSEDLSCQSSPSSPHTQHPLPCHLTPAEHRVPHFCSTLKSFQGMLEISNCSSTWFDSCRGRWQVPICSWQPLEEALKFLILSLFSPFAPNVITHLPPYLRSCCSVAQSCPTLWDPMDCSMPGFPLLHCLLEFAQNHIHWVGDAIQSSCPLLSPSLRAFSLFQHQGLFQWVGIFTSGDQSRKWQPTPVFLPEKSYGQRSPVGYNPKGGKE